MADRFQPAYRFPVPSNKVTLAPAGTFTLFAGNLHGSTFPDAVPSQMLDTHTRPLPYSAAAESSKSSRRYLGA